MTPEQQLSCSQKVIRLTVYLCPRNMLPSNTLIDPDTHAHPSSHTPCSSPNPSTICQQKYGLPTASEDRHEYLCFITPMVRKARRGRQASTAAHLAAWFPTYPAPEWKNRLTASNLWERFVSPPTQLWLPLVAQMPDTTATPSKEDSKKRRNVRGSVLKTLPVLLLSQFSCRYSDLAFGLFRLFWAIACK